MVSDLEERYSGFKNDIMVMKEGVNLLNQRLDSLEIKYDKLEIRVQEIEAKLTDKPQSYMKLSDLKRGGW